ncbi:hypothetical protein ACP4OV_012093 [Aristida adscensionis]
MAPPPPPPPPALTVDAVAEILLRLPPDEPAHLVRAALVCRTWRRVVSDAGFLRLYRARHRGRRLLGYFHNLSYDAGPVPRFVPAPGAAPFPPPALAGPEWWALDCRHGRVLIHSHSPSLMRLVVWDPITGEQQLLARPDHPFSYSSAAVLCAAQGCDHLACDCRGGAFRVVFVGTADTDVVNGCTTWASVYSSEIGAWSAPASIDTGAGYVDWKPSLLLGDELYFTIGVGSSILKYDLGKHLLSEIETPGVFGAIIVDAEDGRLGFVCELDDRIYLLARQDGAIGIAGPGWAELRVIELATLLPRRNPSSSYDLIGFAEGTDTVFISVDVGVFTLELKSGKVRRVGDSGPHYGIQPYMSCYTAGLARVRLSPR